MPVAAPVPRDAIIPGTGLSASVGFFFGGDVLYKFRFYDAPDRNLSAGRGVHVSVGGLWTPLWADDDVGFGVGGRVGWKSDSIDASNGTAKLTASRSAPRCTASSGSARAGSRC